MSRSRRVSSRIAYDIGAEDCGKFKLKTFLCHNGALVKVSNKGTQYSDYSKEHRESDEIQDSIPQMENRFRSVGIGKSGLLKI